MNFETIFSLSNLVIMPFWFLMIALPHRGITKRIIGSPWIILPNALLYTILILPDFGSLFGALANPTLGGIASSLGEPAGATIGWLHFLAFDLFVGRWAFLDSCERSISAWLMAPVLFFILMFGPFGFVLYLVLRLVHGLISGGEGSLYAH